MGGVRDSPLPLRCEVLTAIHAVGLGKEEGHLAMARHRGSDQFGQMRWWRRQWVLRVAVVMGSVVAVMGILRPE